MLPQIPTLCYSLPCHLCTNAPSSASAEAFHHHTQYSLLPCAISPPKQHQQRQVLHIHLATVSRHLPLTLMRVTHALRKGEEPLSIDNILLLYRDTQLQKQQNLLPQADTECVTTTFWVHKTIYA